MPAAHALHSAFAALHYLVLFFGLAATNTLILFAVFLLGHARLARQAFCVLFGTAFGFFGAAANIRVFFAVFPLGDARLTRQAFRVLFGTAVFNTDIGAASFKRGVFAVFLL